MSESDSPKGLLLTGPPGCGKSTTVKVLCTELGIEVLEFDANQHEYELTYSGDELLETSMLSLFVQFLRHAEFVSIEKQSLSHRLLLIEQLPNVFYRYAMGVFTNISKTYVFRDPEKFRDTMLNYVRSSRCMLVFALSNVDRCWEIHPTRLFTAELLDACSISHIKFNNVATSLMKKAVNRVLTLVNVKPGVAVVSKIVEAAGGEPIRRPFQ